MDFLRNFWKKPTPLVELGLTIPLFVFYHLAIPLSSYKNVFDPLSKLFYDLANYSIGLYLLYVAALGGFIFGLFLFLDKNRSFSLGKFFLLALESTLYAIIAALFSQLAVHKLLAIGAGKLDSFIGSFGAGFYEELVFRVLFYGLGLQIILWLSSANSTKKPTSKIKTILLSIAWAILVSFIFSLVHYVLGARDTFQLSSFLFRMFMGICLTLIYVSRGFAVAVWTHTIFDIMVTVNFLR